METWTLATILREYPVPENLLNISKKGFFLLFFGFFLFFWFFFQEGPLAFPERLYL